MSVTVDTLNRQNFTLPFFIFYFPRRASHLIGRLFLLLR